ncbi:MAG: hypothetical protein ABIH28_01965 [archaeon]
MKKSRLIISNRALYTFLFLLMGILVLGGIYALSPGVAPNPGHPISEIGPPAGCTAGQVLKFDGSAWVCGAVGSSGNDTICKNGVCCPLWKDCDGDGYTGGYHDCDESCPTCYVGGKALKAADGKDQNCNGNLDEPINQNYGYNDACEWVIDGPYRFMGASGNSYLGKAAPTAWISQCTKITIPGLQCPTAEGTIFCGQEAWSSGTHGSCSAQSYYYTCVGYA